MLSEEKLSGALAFKISQPEDWWEDATNCIYMQLWMYLNI